MNLRVNSRNSPFQRKKQNKTKKHQEMIAPADLENKRRYHAQSSENVKLKTV